MVTAQDLAYHREPPTRVKMLVRDFIDDSLYNVSSMSRHSLIAAALWILLQARYDLHTADR